MAEDTENPTDNGLDKERDEYLKQIESEFKCFIETYGEPGDIDLDKLSDTERDKCFEQAERIADLAKQIENTYEGQETHLTVATVAPGGYYYRPYLFGERRRPDYGFSDDAWNDYRDMWQDDPMRKSTSTGERISMTDRVRQLVDVFIYSEIGDYQSGDPPPSEYKEYKQLNDMVSGGYFQPDHWQENLADIADIKPVEMPESPDQFQLPQRPKLPIPVRTRLEEVFSSYVHGNWLACIAISLTLMEYCMIDRKHILGVKVLEDETKTARCLHDIIDSIDPDKYPVEDMKKVQEYGNEVMNPVNARKVNSVVFHQSQALACIKSLSRVLSALYRTNKPYYKIT